MTDAVFSSRMTTLLGLFDVNAGLSNEVPNFVRKLSKDELEILRQAFFAPQAFDLLVIDRPTFDAQQFGDLAVAVAPILLG